MAKTAQTKPRIKRQFRFGNDGYGSKNLTAQAHRTGIEIVKTDPHGWGRVSDRLFIDKQDLPDLVRFLLDQI